MKKTAVIELKTKEDIEAMYKALLGMKSIAPKSLKLTVAVLAERNTIFTSTNNNHDPERSVDLELLQTLCRR